MTLNELITGVLLSLLFLIGIWLGLSTHKETPVPEEVNGGFQWEVKDGVYHFSSFPYPIN